jgi:hypothetical protein
MNTRESHNLYEAYLSVYDSGESEIISYLIDEGYADSPDSAYVIMENMSEDWKNVVKKTIQGAGEVVGATVNGIRGRKTPSRNPLARAANATSRVASKSIAKSNFAKRAKRFAKYTGLGMISGALLK